MSSRQVAAFEKAFRGEAKPLFAQALDGSLPACIRSVAWRFFLGVLPSTPPETWESHLATARARYLHLVGEHCTDPHEASSRLEDASIANPLSQHEASPWEKYFSSQELRSDIDKDLARLHPGFDFFADGEIVAAMRRVLLVWSLEHSQLSYRQGMHELLAPFIHVAVTEAAEADAAGSATTTTAPGSSRAVLSAVLSPEFAEADAYALFDQLMVHASGWFEPSAAAAAHDSGGGAAGGGSRGEEARRASVLARQCEHIQHTLLRQADAQLHARLGELQVAARDPLERTRAPPRHATVALGPQVPPQLYLLRWLRLLFGREFHFEDGKVVWDAIFAHGQARERGRARAAARMPPSS